MVVYRSQVESNGTPQGVCLGTIIYEGLQGDFTKDIRADIRTDLNPFQPAQDNYAIALWSAALVNTAGHQTTQGLDGNPARFRLGSISFGAQDIISDFYYWNYLKQGFPSYICIVSPGGAQPAPTSTAEIPAFRNTGSIYPANSVPPAQPPFVVIRDTNVNRPYLFGMSRLGVAPYTQTQVYTVAINYWAGWANAPILDPSTYVVNI